MNRAELSRKDVEEIYTLHEKQINQLGTISGSVEFCEFHMSAGNMRQIIQALLSDMDAVRGALKEAEKIMGERKSADQGWPEYCDIKQALKRTERWEVK